MSSSLVRMFYIEKDQNFAVYSTSGKILAFNSSVIIPRNKKNSQGVIVMKQGKYKVKNVEICDENSMRKYFRKNIPSSGVKLINMAKQLKF